MKAKTQISASLMFDLIDFELHSKIEFRNVRENLRHGLSPIRLYTNRLQDAFEWMLNEFYES